MGKILVFLALFITYITYSLLVYTRGTENKYIPVSEQQARIVKGKIIFQEKNCIACHQLFGLGGYLGPELTTAWSDPHRGETYIKAFLQSGGKLMPDFKFNTEEVDALVQYLRYVDSTATTYK